MNLFVAIALSIAVAYAAIVAAFFFNQERLVYFPESPGRKLEATPAALGLDYEDIVIETSDRVKLHGWFVPARDKLGVLLFLHGNAGNISHRLDSLGIFNRIGLSTLIIDYRGYGRSAGRPSEAGTYLDAEAAWNFLTATRGFSSDRIVVLGRSLGGAVAAHLASRHTPAALVLESTFTSIPDLGQTLYSLLPVRLMSRLRYDTLACVRTLRCPLLVIHSKDDEIIPFEHGHHLYRAAPANKSLLKIHGSHGNGYLVSGLIYEQGLADFLRKVLDRAEMVLPGT